MGDTTMMARRVFVAAMALLAGVLSGGIALAGPTDGAVKVLFLGDNRAHNPSDRQRQVVAPLHDRGIDIVYTPDIESLNEQTLSGYDVLLIYANHEQISLDQERALIGFVESGGGLAAIHCASFCFHNSPAYIEIVGAQFRSHGTGVFQTRLTGAEHLLNDGREAIESWDETYVHSRHNSDRIVLEERVEGDHVEPWTWVRNQGNGRVFYTAWGHDERTWGNEGFVDLLERGIKWSAGDWALDLTADPGEFEYVEGRVPNYPPSPRWGVTADPITKIQEPLSPEESAKRMVVPADLEPHLFVSEPQIVNPLAMAWDEQGRLWVAESTDYPNELKEVLGEGNDRITICEDTDGDGVADKFTVFAEGLSIVTGMVPYDGGVILASTPRILFLKDTDGDDKADERRVLMEGWGTNDTHATLSNLHYGLDNWVYGTIGYSGFNGEVGGESHQFGNGVWRMKPDGSKLEFLRSTSNNTWGLGITEEGLVVGSTANGASVRRRPGRSGWWSRTTVESSGNGTVRGSTSTRLSKAGR